MSKYKDILVVSTADWNNPYWTNKQHVAVQFAKEGHRVFYVESQGLRAPTATGKDLRRIWSRLKRGLTAPKEVRPNLYVFSPLVLPFHRFGLVRGINRFILRTAIGTWCRILRMRPSVLWTYSPMTSQLYNLDDYGLVVYHAVDDVKVQPGVPREAVEVAEEDLSRRADLIFTTAPALQEWHSKRNQNTHYFSNVADYEHFNAALSANTPIPADILQFAEPRIGFIGAISSYKLDFTMIEDVARSNPNWSFVFVGEIGEGDPLTDASSLEASPNIHFLGGRPYKDLPGYLKGMDVAILPNLVNEYTRSMFPMKFFEYLAAGKPVVSTELPALSDYRHVASFTDSPAAFSAAIAEALTGKGAALDVRLQAAKEQTYEIRTRKMLTIMDQVKAR